MKAFIDSQFAHFPLTRIFCSRSSDNRINNLHERILRIVYNDHSSIFEDFLTKDNSVSIRHRKIALLTIELCKAENNLSSQPILDLFQRREVNYNIHSQKDFLLRSVNTSSYCLKSLRYLEPKFQNLVPLDILPTNSFSQFTRKIKSCVLHGWHFLLYYTYIG